MLHTFYISLLPLKERNVRRRCSNQVRFRIYLKMCCIVTIQCLKVTTKTMLAYNKLQTYALSVYYEPLFRYSGTAKLLSRQTAMPQRLYCVLKTCQRAVGSPRNTPKDPVTPNGEATAFL